MKLIVSTTGFTSPEYLSGSGVEDISVPKVEDIRYGRRTGQPGTQYDRGYAYIEMTPQQALGVALDILTKLHLDEGTIGNWSIQFPEREEPKSEWQPYADGPADASRTEVTLPSGTYAVPDWDVLDRTQRVECGRHGIRYVRDSKHAAWIRREAKKRGLKASVQLGDGIAAVRLYAA